MSQENLSLNKSTGRFEHLALPFSLEELQEMARKKYADYEKIPMSCPYGYDNDEIVNNTKKVLNQTKYSFNVDIEFLLSANPHTHEHFVLKKKSSIENESEEIEFGDLGCGLALDLTVNADVNLSNIDQFEATPKEFAESIKGETLYLEEGEGEAFRKTFSELNDYIKKNFTDEVYRIVERLIKEFYMFDKPSELREKFINEILDKEKEALQKRIPATKGRVATKQRSDLRILKVEFVIECHKKLKELESENLSLNKNRLARKLFSRADNPLLFLNRKLKELDLSFEEILNLYKESKSLFDL